MTDLLTRIERAAARGAGCHRQIDEHPSGRAGHAIELWGTLDPLACHLTNKPFSRTNSMNGSVLKHPKSAEAVFIGGNGFGAIGVIEALEENLNRPILTANQVAFRNTDAGTEMVTMRWGMPRHRARAAAGHASGPDERQSRTLRARRGAARQSRRRGRLAHYPEKLNSKRSCAKQ